MSDQAHEPQFASADAENSDVRRFDFSTYYPNWRKKVDWEITGEELADLPEEEFQARLEAQRQLAESISEEDRQTSPQEKIAILYDDLDQHADIAIQMCNEFLLEAGSDKRLQLIGAGPQARLDSKTLTPEELAEEQEGAEPLSAEQVLRSMEYIEGLHTTAKNLGYVRSIMQEIEPREEEQLALWAAVADASNSYMILVRSVMSSLYQIDQEKLAEYRAELPILEKHYELETDDSRFPREMHDVLKEVAREALAAEGNAEPNEEDIKNFDFQVDQLYDALDQAINAAASGGKAFTQKQIDGWREKIKKAGQNDEIKAMQNQTYDGHSFVGIEYPEGFNYNNMDDAVTHLLATHRGGPLSEAAKQLFALGVTHNTDMDSKMMSLLYGEEVHDVRSAFVEGMGVSEAAWDGMLRTDVTAHYVQNDGLGFSKPGRITFEEAKEIVVEAFTNINPEMGRRAAHAFEDGWFHNVANPHSLTAGFSATPPVSAREWTGSKGFVYSPFQGKMWDVVVMGHEMMHALHGDQTSLSYDEKDSNLAYAETLAHLMEFQIAETMIKRAETPEEKMNIATNYMGRETGLYEQIRTLTQISADLHDEIKTRDKPFTYDELKQIVEKRWESSLHGAMSSNPDAAEGFLLNACGDMAQPRQTFYSPAYGFAVLAARAYTKAYLEADEETRKEMGEKLLQNGLGATPGAGWADTMAELGVDMRKADIVESVANFPLEYLQRVVDEHGATMPTRRIATRNAQGELSNPAAELEKSLFNDILLSRDRMVEMMHEDLFRPEQVPAPSSQEIRTISRSDIRATKQTRPEGFAAQERMRREQPKEQQQLGS